MDQLIKCMESHGMDQWGVCRFEDALPLLEVRAKRRFEELKAKGDAPSYEKVLEDIKVRDYNDSHRAFAPLKQADDAVLVDTTNMSIDEVIDFVLNKMEK